MEPAGFHQSVPLPENRHVQYTTVAINSTEPPPKDYIVWSIFNLVYCNPLCLGLTALYYSVKTRDKKVAGDLEGSRKLGFMACCFNSIALILGVILFIVVIIRFVTLLNELQEMHQQMFNRG